MFWTLHLIDCLYPFCLFSGVLVFFHLGHVSLSPHFDSLPVCFCVLGRATMSPKVGRVAWGSRYPIGSSGRASPIMQAGYSRCTLCVGCIHPPLVVEPWLLLAGQWEGFTQAGQLQGLADHWPPTSTLCGGSALQELAGCAPARSAAVHWVCRLWDFLGDTGQS